MLLAKRMTRTGHLVVPITSATDALMSSDAYGNRGRTHLYWCAKSEPPKPRRVSIACAGLWVGQTNGRNACEMSWKLRWAGWNRGMKRVRLSNSRFGFVNALIEPFGSRQRISCAQNLASAINRAVTQGDKAEVERLQLLAQSEADRHLNRP